MASQLTDESAGLAASYRDWFIEFSQLSADFALERERFEHSKIRVAKLAIFDPVRRDIRLDLDILDSIVSDFRAGLNLMNAGRKVSQLDLFVVSRLGWLLLGVVQAENDGLELLFKYSIQSALIFLPFDMMALKARYLQKRLEELVEELREAELEVRKAEIKFAIHALIATAEELFTPLKLASRFGILVTEHLIDRWLGPEKPTTKQKNIGYIGFGTSVAKQVFETVHHIENPKMIFGHKVTIGHGTRSVANQLGKGATVGIFYLDLLEITETREHAAELSEALKETQHAYDDLREEIGKAKPKLALLYTLVQQWTREIEALRMDADLARKAFSEDKAELAWPRNYYPGQPMLWKFSN
jgi:hypothetical protein